MTSPLRISARVEIDPSQAVQGGARASEAVEGIGNAAVTAESKLQRLINSSVGLHSGPANNNARVWTGLLASEGMALDNLRAKYNPTYAAIQNYKKAVTEIRTAYAQAAISADEMTAAMSRQRQMALGTIAALKGRDGLPGMLGGSSRNDQFRRQNLTYQLFDIGQTAAMGMNPAMIFAQQGPQILQLYAGQGGVNAALKDLGTIAGGAARLITPLTVSIGALTATTAIGLIAWNKYLTSTKEVETAASGLGRAVAGTKSEMEAAAQAGAAAAGISVASARSMQAQFLRSGTIGSENFGALIAMSKDFAATIGVDADAAGQALTELFSDPAQAAQTLYREYGLIDAATARHASNLAAQNRHSEAQAVLLKALPGQLADASEATTALGRAWNFVKTSASDAMDAIGGAIDAAVSGPSIDERIAKAAAEYERFSKQSWFLRTFNGAGDRAAQAKLDLETLTEEKRLQERLAFEQQRRAEEISRSRAAVTLAEGSGANRSTLREQELRNEIAALQSGRAGLAGDPVGQGMVDTAIEAKTRALEALVDRQRRAIELDRLDIEIATERNPLLRAELEARRTRLQMAEQEVSSETIAAEVARARNRVIEETIATARAQSADMRADLDARRNLNTLLAAGTITSADANRLLQEEAALRPLVVAAAAAEGAEKTRLNEVITELRSGYAALAEEENVTIAGGLGGLGGGLSSLLGANDNSAPASPVSSAIASIGAGGVTRSGAAVDLAGSLLGSSETANASQINSFLKLGGVDIDAARTAWCAGFVNSALKQVGVDGSGSLLANSFQKWGTQIDPSQVLRGDVLLQSNGLSALQPGGHVGFATGATRMFNGQQQLEMLSGNYSNSVGTGWFNAVDLQVRRATEAADALSTLSSSSATATQGLGQFGSGLGSFGQALSGAGAQAGSGGGLFSWLGGLFGGGGGGQWAAAVAGTLKPGLFDKGGPTGGSNPARIAGLVHEQEFVFDAASTARIGVDNLEAMRRGKSPAGVIRVQPMRSAGRSASAAPTPVNFHYTADIRVSGNGDKELMGRMRQAAEETVRDGFDQYRRVGVQEDIKRFNDDPYSRGAA